MSPFNKDTRDKMAAAEALGLSYWADHPLNGRVWAVDDSQQVHIVRIRRKDRTACVQRVSITKVNEWRGGFRRTVDKVSTYDTGSKAGF